MNSTEFEIILENRLNAARNTLASKAKEYARGDRLHNFKAAARVKNTTVRKALFGMALKHLVSVLDLVDGFPEYPTAEYVDEKIGDMINYLILLEAIVKEEIQKDKPVEPNYFEHDFTQGPYTLRKHTVGSNTLPDSFGMH